jgi:hypothetical protein
LFTVFIPCKAFKGVKERAQKKEIIGEKEKQALGRRNRSGPELLSRGSWHIGEEALRRFKRLEKR